MTIDQLIDRLVELNEAGYGPEEIVLTTRSGSVVDPFHLAIVNHDGERLRVPRIEFPGAEIFS